MWTASNLAACPRTVVVILLEVGGISNYAGRGFVKARRSLHWDIGRWAKLRRRGSIWMHRHWPRGIGGVVTGTGNLGILPCWRRSSLQVRMWLETVDSTVVCDDPEHRTPYNSHAFSYRNVSNYVSLHRSRNKGEDLCQFVQVCRLAQPYRNSIAQSIPRRCIPQEGHLLPVSPTPWLPHLSYHHFPSSPVLPPTAAVVVACLNLSDD